MKFKDRLQNKVNTENLSKKFKVKLKLNLKILNQKSRIPFGMTKKY